MNIVFFRLSIRDQRSCCCACILSLGISPRYLTSDGLPGLCIASGRP